MQRYRDMEPKEVGVASCANVYSISDIEAQMANLAETHLQ